MKITEQDSEEVTRVAELIKRVDTMDQKYVNSISDEIFKKQPFFLTVLLGHRLDLTLAQLEEVMKLYFIVWEYFNKNVQTRLVTEDLFERVQQKNIEMLKYANDEPTDKDRQTIYKLDIENIKSQSLLAAVLFRFNECPDLISIDMETGGLVLIGIKTFIECFEAI